MHDCKTPCGSSTASNGMIQYTVPVILCLEVLEVEGKRCDGGIQSSIRRPAAESGITSKVSPRAVHHTIKQATMRIYRSQPEVGVGVGAELKGVCVGAGVS
jgi:hypothetical protein